MPLPVGRLVGLDHRQSPLPGGAGEEQCLGEMPWMDRATAIKPGTGDLVLRGSEVKRQPQF